MHFNSSKKELVYHTTNHRDGKLIELATLCIETNARLVLIIPTIKKYTFEIKECFRILGDDFLIYEMNMGMGIVLASRARKYVEYIETAELYEQD
jgi:presenilin-like A22 family membrane protease